MPLQTLSSWADLYRIRPVRCADNTIYLFLAMRALAALRRLAMRLRAYLIGSSSTASGIVFIRPFFRFRMALVGGV